MGLLPEEKRSATHSNVGTASRHLNTETYNI
jgi:hypothetical protein